jgi:hypothetical protein
MVLNLAPFVAGRCAVKLLSADYRCVDGSKKTSKFDQGPCCTRNPEELSMMNTLNLKRNSDFWLKKASTSAVNNSTQLFYSLTRRPSMHLLIPPPGHKTGSAAFLAMASLLATAFLFLLTINAASIGIAIFISNSFTSPYAIANFLSNMKHMHNQQALGIALVFAHYPLIGFAWGFISPINAKNLTQALLVALKRFFITFVILSIPGLSLGLLFVPS